MKRILSILAPAILIVGSASFAQAQEGVTEVQIDAALRDLSAVYGSPVLRTDQARAICNEEQYMFECAEIGKRHGLFPSGREEEVDAILNELKGKVVDELKQCENTECLIEVATKIARNLSAENPSLARAIELTPPIVKEKQAIVEIAREVGVDFDECRAMDPDSASVELLRACAKLAKHERMERYIPEENRVHVEKAENTADLKEALDQGELACGDGTLEGCGTFCLNASASMRGEGISAIPPVCREIAERYFGPEGVLELEHAYEDVRDSYDEARRIYEERRFEDRGEYPDARRYYEESSTTPHIACPRVDYRPCPTGHYRQESVSELGCFTLGACIPFNTETQKEVGPDDKHFLCPSLPTVDSCAPNEEKVVTYTSPECGTYYSCKPKPEARTTKFPYTFGSERVVLSFEEARIYCYESGSRGATARGDKKECLDAFGISVPAISSEKQCAEYGMGWHTMDESGNCFNPSMTEYRTSGGALRMCSESKVYGCKDEGGEWGKPQDGQKEQIWNSHGLRSWIRADASESRIAELKAACAGVSSGANVWLPGSGTASSDDFGMPDPAKCAKAAACTSTQYFNGSECVKQGSGEWCSEGQYWNGSSCVPSSATTTWDTKEHTCPSGQYWNGSACEAKGETVSGSCSSDIKTLLGSGCHSMGNAWFNGAMSMYILPNSTLVKSCVNEKIAGCSGSHTAVTCPAGQFWSGSSCVSSEGTICAANEYWDSGKGACTSSARACTDAKGSWDSSKNICVMPPPPTPTLTPTPTPSPTSLPAGQKMQVWNSYGLQSSIRSDADLARIATLKEACTNVKSSSNIWMSGAGTYSSADFGMPDPAKCQKATQCASDQTFDGTSCTTSGSWTTGGGSGGMQRCFYTNATRNGTSLGYSVWCESDYYNCHEGTSSGPSISLTGVSLGAPSQCEGGGSSSTNTTIGSECRSQSSQSSCSAVSGCYWYTGYSGNYCDSSGSAATSGGGSGTSGSLGCYTYSSQSSCRAVSGCYWVTPSGGSPGCSDYPDGGSGTGGGCGMYGSESSCNAMSACEWQSSVCGYKSSGSSGSSTSCPSGQYWSGSACVPTQTTTDYSQMQSSCASAGGTWDSSSNYCRMPSASIGGQPLAYLCPLNHVWNGGYCVLSPKGNESFVASVFSAFLSLFGI